MDMQKKQSLKILQKTMCHGNTLKNNRIYFSSLLKTISAYQPAANNLFAALDLYNIKYEFILSTKDIWVRDFMPIKRKDGKYISFRYEPSYLKDRPELCTDFKRNIGDDFLNGEILYSNICLDGGNVVFSPSKQKVIVSSRVFSENPKWEKAKLTYALERILQAEVFIISSLKSDMTGHADGMVRFIDENTCIGNRTEYKYGLEQTIKRMLNKRGIEVIDFPYVPDHGISAVGCYLNFLEIGNIIFLPVFDIAEDEEAIRTAKTIFINKNIVPICINEIAKDGGCLNCISWSND